MHVVAFDPSLSCTGWARGRSQPSGEPRVEVARIVPKNLMGERRLVYIRDEVLRRADGAGVVVLEGYAFARENQAHQLGELGGVLRVALHEAGLPFVVLAPSKLKLYATGKGNAKKEEVLAEAVRRLRYAGSSTDEADALWLLAMAFHGYGVPIWRVPQNHLRGLRDVRWPTPREEATTCTGD